MTEKERQAQLFSSRWKGRGNEKQDKDTFWIDLLMNVFGVKDFSANVVSFEVKTKMMRGRDFKDVVLYRFDKDREVLIEQKSHTIALDRKLNHSSGQKFTAFEQAKYYDDFSTSTDKARWIITCNFQEFWIYDMTKEGAVFQEPVKLKLEDLYKHLDWLAMLEPDPEAGRQIDLKQQQEVEVSEQAARLIGKLYNKLDEQYVHHDKQQLNSLNRLCVRIVFCLYAEDSGIFSPHQFYDYLKDLKAEAVRTALVQLFRALDTGYDKRDALYLTQQQANFPYVNGGLFAGEIEIPMFTDEIKTILLEEESAGFDWSKISPAIFGAMFEYTINPETRGQNGMHYTSVKDIRKVVGPLFLDQLEVELNSLLARVTPDIRKLTAFQDKLASLTFLDPACGSGNFLTYVYTQLRHMENQILRKISSNSQRFGVALIKVTTQQFFGFEKNDFAVAVAKTALWIAESQMLAETKEILYDYDFEFLPLKSNVNIVVCNALKVDWNDIVPNSRISYIIGNPPFVGFSKMTPEQKDELKPLFPKVKNIDYVCGWYKKASDYIRGTMIEVAFISTNSITQGETVARFWKFLPDDVINFAYRSFRWKQGAQNEAKVYCVIIGFAKTSRQHKIIYNADGSSEIADNINKYLLNAEDIIVKSRTHPLCAVKDMVYGNKPYDGGNLIIEDSDLADFLSSDSKAQKFIRPLIGAREYMNGMKRWVIWLDGARPGDIAGCPMIMDRIHKCKEYRLNPEHAGARKFADTPGLFAQITQPADADFIVLPRTSSGKRAYVPMSFVKAGTMVTDTMQLIPGGTLYDFGILMSRVHMLWMGVVCGRLKVDYIYSKDVVYNNFPWPDSTQKDIEKITATASDIMEVREKYKDEKLKDLYSPDLMPPDLLKAHHKNDAAVMSAYGFASSMTDTEIITALFDMYTKLIKTQAD